MGRPNEAEVERSWRETWRDIILRAGRVNLSQVKRELHDYSFVLSQVSKVYDHVTGGRVSKQNTYASAVIAEHDDYVTRQLEEALEDEQPGKLAKALVKNLEQNGVRAELLERARALAEDIEEEC